MNNGSLAVLLVEDSPDDAFFLERILRKSGYYPEIKRVETETQLREAFEGGEHWDIVITDYRLPEFSGLRAIRLVAGSDPFLPVILVSGRVGEETAVEAIRSGAKDYVLKDNLTRLPSVVEREINTARQKREREKVQQALSDSEERFSIMFKISPDPIVMTVGPRAKVVDANDSFLKLMGMDLDAIQRRSLSHFILTDGEGGVEQLPQRLHKGDDTLTLETSLLPAVGEGMQRGPGRKVLWSVRRIPGSEETLLIWIGKDLTEHAALERKLRESDKLRSLGTLAGGIAHDFNNILMIMMGYAEMALDQVDENQKLGRYLSEIHGSVLRAKEMIQQILTFSRGTEGERSYLQLSPIIKEVLKLLRPSLPASIRIQSHIESSYFAHADPTHIHQIVMNLCMNAYHAMREDGGTLTIRTGDLEPGEVAPCCTSRLEEGIDGHRVYLQISDTGVGMSETVAERAFEPFFTTRDVSEGTGLGLSMVHGIVESYGGAIALESELGEGTSVFCSFPAVTASEERALSEETLPAAEHLGGQLLVVDDEEKIVELLTMMLIELGYQVISARSGDEAYERLREAPGDFDGLITDLTMPGLSGVELSRKAKQLSPRLPVILCSGYKEMRLGEEEDAIDVFLPKPVRKTTLAKVVADAISGTSRALKE